MPHLTLEALARLVDEAPDSEEKRHLERCEQCSEELRALQEQTEALSALPRMVPPPDAWPALRARLAEEGLIAGARRRDWSPALTRVAAALALFLTGSAAGYVARGPVEAPPTPEPIAAADPAPAMDPDPAAVDPGPVRQADLEVAEAQERFAVALDRYMMENSTEAPDPATRLAALDNIVLTTAEALNESPADPVINSYHLTAVAQRNELLRQIAAAAGEPVF